MEGEGGTSQKAKENEQMIKCAVVVNEVACFWR